jgi:hypothetical protein
MIYFMLALLYCDAEVDAGTGRQKYRWLAPATIAAAIYNTVVYYTFSAIVLGLSRDIYHYCRCSHCMEFVPGTPFEESHHQGYLSPWP